jgi:hypothetical protein
MKWFRSNIRLGSRLALCALAIQFLLSFGHFHGSAQAAPVSAKRLALDSAHSNVVDGAAQTNASASVLPRTSPGREPAGHANDDCAICAVMALASIMVGATPPDLTAPQATAFSYVAGEAGFVQRGSARVAFQPRAPPIA